MRKLIAAAAVLLISSVSANAAVITGNYTVSSNNNSTGIINLLSNPFTLNLALGVSQTFNLAWIWETRDGTSNLSALFNFTAPSSTSALFTGTDTFSTPGNSVHEDLNWTNNSLTKSFADGSVVKIALGDVSYNGSSFNYAGLIAPVTFTLTQAATPVNAVPEPFTMSVFGMGLVGAAAMVRRRRKQTA
jgi:hypothetical protein